ncbi:hypothetical protein Tco_0713612 [Tanacetum coccineum]
MERYISAKEEKAQKHGKVSVEIEFPAIYLNDGLSSENTLSCELTVSSLNNEVDFIISFDDSNDEDHTTQYDVFSKVNTTYKDPDFDAHVRRIDSHYTALLTSNLYILHMAPLPLREQRHPFLRYQGLEYTDANIADFDRGTDGACDDGGVVCLLASYSDLFDIRGTLLGGARRRMSWRQFIVALGLHTGEEMESPVLLDTGARRSSAEALILKRPFLSTARAKIDVYKRKITLRVREERIVFTSVKPASCLIKRVYMLGLRERMELNLEARLMGENLVLNRSLDPFLEDYIDLNDLNEPLELRRNQGDDLMPTIEEGRVIKEFKTRDDELNTEIDDYPSYCDYGKKINIDCAHNLKFSCMIGFEFTHANFFPLLYVNVISKNFHNSIMKEKMVYKGNNIIAALINVPIFVGTFSVMTDFVVLKNMDDYRDEEMGNVIFGEPFLREVRIKVRRFEGIITIYNGDDEVTYQMVRSHPRFKHHTNEQCNKIPPLLKVSEKDEKNGISHAYQKLKGFYKGVLNLGPDYIRDAKTEEWLTRGHISVHEMEW